MRALIFTWDGFQDQEVIYPFYRLQEAGFEVEIFGPGDRVTGLLGTKFDTASYSSLSLDYSKADLLVLPGGVKALEKLRQEFAVLDYIKYWPKNKVISSICHGAQLLISAQLVKGKNISGYYSLKDDIENAGGRYYRSPVVSWNIVSGAHYRDMPEWMKLTLKTYEEFQKYSSS